MANGTQLKKVLNTFLNPLSTNTLAPKWFKPFGGQGKATEMNRILLHVMALMATYGGGSYMLRHLSSKMGRKEEQGFDDELAALMNAREARWSPDPDLSDIKEEKSKFKMGIPKYKDSLEKLSAEKQAIDPINLAYLLPVLSVILASKAGYSIADKQIDTETSAQLDRGISEAENKYEATSYDNLLRSKGLTRDQVADLSAEMTKTAGWFGDDQYKRGWMDWVYAVAVLAAGMSAYTGFTAGNKYFKANDPNRLQRKRLLNEAKSRLRSDSPPVLVPDLHPKLSAILKKGGGARKKSKTPKTKSLSSSGADLDPATKILAQSIS